MHDDTAGTFPANIRSKRYQEINEVGYFRLLGAMVESCCAVGHRCSHKKILCRADTGYVEVDFSALEDFRARVYYALFKFDLRA